MIDFQRLMGNRKLQTAFLIFAAMVGFILLVELAMNVWIRSSLKAGLGGNNPNAKIAVSINWMGLKDLWQGRVNRIRIDGRNCRIGNLDYERLQLNNQGFSLDLPVLLKEKRLEITSIRRTKISASVSANALQDYINLNHPGFGVEVKIHSGQLELSGNVSLLGNQVPVQLEGQLANSAAKTVEFRPKGFSIAGRRVSGEIIQFINNQLPVKFSIMENWPLMITGILLTEGKLTIDLTESTE